MSKIEKTVFISYRRTNLAFAQLLYEKLTERGYSVFFDFKSLRSGDFEQLLLLGIESKAHFLVLLSPSALKRCNKPNDWLRREIEHAIKKKRNIIPVVFDGFDFAEIKSNLPNSISEPFSKYNAFGLPLGYITEDKINELEEWLNIPLDMVVHPPTPELVSEEKRQQQAISSEIPVTKEHILAEKYFERARRHEDMQNYDFAWDDYKEAITLNPDYIEAYISSGNLYLYLQHYDNAIYTYSQLIRHQPEEYFGYYGRAKARLGIKDYDGASEDIEKARYINPDYTLAYTVRASIKAGMKYYKGAIEDCMIALKREPLNGHVETQVRIILRSLGRNQDQIDDFIIKYGDFYGTSYFPADK